MCGLLCLLQSLQLPLQLLLIHLNGCHLSVLLCPASMDFVVAFFSHQPQMGLQWFKLLDFILLISYSKFNAASDEKLHQERRLYY